MSIAGELVTGGARTPVVGSHGVRPAGSARGRRVAGDGQLYSQWGAVLEDGRSTGHDDRSPQCNRCR